MQWINNICVQPKYIENIVIIRPTVLNIKQNLFKDLTSYIQVSQNIEKAQSCVFCECYISLVQYQYICVQIMY